MVDRALETFVEQLNSLSLIDIGVHVAGLYPLVLVLVVVHEFGHALVGLACTDGLVTVRVGPTSGALRGRVGRLAFSFDPRPGRHAEDGLTELLADLSRRERIAYFMGGPAANLVFAVALWPLFDVLSGVPRYAVGAAIALSVLLAIVNVALPNPASDGRQALAAFRDDEPRTLDGEFVKTMGRWLALHTDTRDRRFSVQRSWLLGVAPVALGTHDGLDGAKAASHR
jgi:hypothetical protein